VRLNLHATRCKEIRIEADIVVDGVDGVGRVLRALLGQD